MVHVLSIWFLVVAFLGAGLVNAIGTSGTRSDFARWGYPLWWGIVTGGLEILSAVLIALPVSRIGWRGACGGHHRGCGLHGSTPPRPCTSCAAQRLCHPDCCCRDRILSTAGKALVGCGEQLAINRTSTIVVSRASSPQERFVPILPLR